ncbi:hypothetical protein [Streptomyces sp. NBC_00280]|uniref:nSTAND1 domain-containing NTPase n=1 Tax=Streptomyces sp. NBC_00280 TaxID=2975699 RepID=UPI0032514EA3
MGRVFISYHAADGGTTAHRLVDVLRSAGYQDCYAYALRGHGPAVSYAWRDELRRNLLAAEALLVVTTEGSAAEWCVWEISLFRERRPEALVVEFFSGVPQGRGILDTRQALRVDPDDPRSMADAERTALLLLDEAGVSRGPALASPFPGLTAFQEEHASVYFGRDQDIDAVARPLLSRRSNGALAVIGPSGAGKSSLVRAGLVPLLRKRPPTTGGGNPYWIVLGPVTPARGGLTALAGTVAEVRRDLGLHTDTAAQVLRRLGERPEGLAELLGDIAGSVRDARILVIVDQAEELLLSTTEAEAEAEASLFVRALAEAVRLHAWLVYTVRADFLDALMRFEAFAPLLRDHHLVKPLSRTELPVVINAPLDTLGWRLDDHALGLMHEDAAGETLPLLAFALQKLWERVNPDGKRPPRAITRSEYEASGRVQEVLKAQAEEAFLLARDSLVDGDRQPVPEAERAVLKALRRLVAVDESGKYTRRPVALRDLPERELRLLRPFVECRVLTTVRHPHERPRSVEPPGSGPEWERLTEDAFEVAHESLFVHWPRLRESLARDHDALRARREIEEIAADWARFGHPPDQLIPASRLLRLLSVLSRHTEGTAGEGEFVEAWPELSGTLRDLYLSGAALSLVEQSLQRMADDETRRAEALVGSDPLGALHLLAGDGSAQADVLVRLLLHAPDLGEWRRTLRRAMAAHPQLRSFHDQEAGLWGVAWSPDDSMVVTGSKDGGVRVRNAVSGELIAEFHHARDAMGGGPGWVRSVDWSADGELIASVSTDQTLRLWSWRTKDEMRIVPLDDRPWSVRFSSSGRQVFVAGHDGRVRVWDVAGVGREPVRTCLSTDKEGNTVRLWDADMSADGRYVAAAREDGLIDLHGPDGDLVQLRQFSDADEARPVRCVRFDPATTADRVRLAAGDQSNQALTHEWIDGRGGRSRRFDGHEDQVRRVAWSPTGGRLATAAADATVRVWSVAGAEELLALRGHGQGVCDVAWSHEGDRLASAADDGSVRIWKVGPEPVSEWEFELSRVAWSPHARRLLLVTGASPDGGWAECVSAGAPPTVSTLRAGGIGSVESLAWSPDGTSCAVVDHNGTASLWEGFEQLRQAPGARVGLRRTTVLTDAHDAVTDAQWSVDGTWLAVVSRDRTWLPRVYDRTGRLRAEPAGWTRHASFLSAVAWHPARTEFAVAGQDNLVTVNSLDTTVAEYRGDRVFMSLAWHPDGTALAVGCTDGTVLVLDHEAGRLSPRPPLRGHRQPVVSLAWSPDGSLLLTGSHDGTAHVWSGRTGGLMTVLRRTGGRIRQVLWLDRLLAATVSEDHRVCFWDVSDGVRRPRCGAPGGEHDDVASLVREARMRAR